jgi:hypothetical protein
LQFQAIVKKPIVKIQLPPSMGIFAMHCKKKAPKPEKKTHTNKNTTCRREKEKGIWSQGNKRDQGNKKEGKRKRENRIMHQEPSTLHPLQTGAPRPME